MAARGDLPICEALPYIAAQIVGGCLGTIARAFTDTFAGIQSTPAVSFIIAQIIGAGLDATVDGWLFKAAPAVR